MFLTEKQNYGATVSLIRSPQLPQLLGYHHTPELLNDYQYNRSHLMDNEVNHWFFKVGGGMLPIEWAATKLLPPSALDKVEI